MHVLMLLTVLDALLVSFLVLLLFVLLVLSHVQPATLLPVTVLPAVLATIACLLVLLVAVLNVTMDVRNVQLLLRYVSAVYKDFITIRLTNV